MSELVNPHRGEVMLDLPDGRQIGLRLDANAVCVAERALGGRSLTEIVTDLGVGRISITVVRALLWAAVQGYDAKHPKKVRRTFTLEDAGNTITDVGPQSSAEKVLEALNLAFPRQEDVVDEPGEQKDQEEGDAAGKATTVPTGHDS